MKYIRYNHRSIFERVERIHTAPLKLKRPLSKQ